MQQVVNESRLLLLLRVQKSETISDAVSAFCRQGRLSGPSPETNLTLVGGAGGGGGATYVFKVSIPAC
jgi:hypothetical protein